MGVVVDSDRMLRCSRQSLAHHPNRPGVCWKRDRAHGRRQRSQLWGWEGSGRPHDECVRAHVKLAIGQGQKRRGEGPESLAIWFDDASAAWPLHGLPSMHKTAVANHVSGTSGQAARNGEAATTKGARRMEGYWWDEEVRLDTTIELEREVLRRGHRLLQVLDEYDPYRAMLEEHLRKLEDAVSHLELLTDGALRWLVEPEASPPPAGTEHVRHDRSRGRAD